MLAKGEFDVTIEPVGSDAIDVGRMTLRKSFRGDLEGSSVGQMLSHRSAVEGSAGYVALERVSATLDGRSGSFVLIHLGTMSQATIEQQIPVVPDSADGELTGLKGRMEIFQVDGQHTYRLEYELPNATS